MSGAEKLESDVMSLCRRAEELGAGILRYVIGSSFSREDSESDGISTPKQN